MSLYAAGDFGYLQQIEAYFLSYTRVGVMLSSLDTELIRQWKLGGIPVEAVCSGIKQTFKNFDEPPRSIHQCRHHINSEIEAWLSHRSDAPSTSTQGSQLPGRDLPDPTRLRSGRPSRIRNAKHHPKIDPVPPTNPDDPDALHIPDDETLLRCWYRSMHSLVTLGRSDAPDLTLDAYRWAYRQMVELRQRALEIAELTRLVALLPLAIGEIEAGMYELAFNSLDREAQEYLEHHFSPEMRNALKFMSPDARERQLNVWRRRVMEDALDLKPFFTP